MTMDAERRAQAISSGINAIHAMRHADFSYLGRDVVSAALDELADALASGEDMTISNADLTVLRRAIADEPIGSDETRAVAMRVLDGLGLDL